MTSNNPTLIVSHKEDDTTDTTDIASNDGYDSAIDDYYGSSYPQPGPQNSDQLSMYEHSNSPSYPNSPQVSTSPSPISPSIDTSTRTTPIMPPSRHINYQNKNPYEEQINFSDPKSGTKYTEPTSLSSSHGSTNDTQSPFHLSPIIADLSSAGSTHSPASNVTAAAAVMAQEMSAVQALKRLSIGAVSTLDPDLPNYSSETFRPAGGESNSIPSSAVRRNSNSFKEATGFDFSPRPSRSMSAPSTSASSRLFGVPSERTNEITQRSEKIKASQASQLLWVPAHVHPEIAPQQWKSFVQNKLAEIKSTTESQSKNSSTSKESAIRSNSLSSLNSVHRRYSRLSRQINDQESYTDGADVLEKRRSTDSVQQFTDPSIQTLSHQLETLGELEGWSVDPAQLVRSLSTSSSYHEQTQDATSGSQQDQTSQVPLANDSDSPILPSPTSSLRRSTRTLYEKSSIKRGRRDIIERSQLSDSSLQSQSSVHKAPSISSIESTDSTIPPPPPSKDPVFDINKSLPASPVESTINSPITVDDPGISRVSVSLLKSDVADNPVEHENNLSQGSEELHSHSELTPLEKDPDGTEKKTHNIFPPNKSEQSSDLISVQPNNPVEQNTSGNRQKKDLHLNIILGPKASPVSPISPISPESPLTDDEYEHSSNPTKSKSRKGTWGWLFNNNNSGGNGVPPSISDRKSPSQETSSMDLADKSSVDSFLNRASNVNAPSTATHQPPNQPEVIVTSADEPSESIRARKTSNGGITEKKDRITNFFSKKKSSTNLKQQPTSPTKTDSQDKLKPTSSSSSASSRGRQSKHLNNLSKQAGNKNKSGVRYRSRSRNKSPEREQSTEQGSITNATPVSTGTIAAGLVAYSPEAAAYYGAPYQIPAHQYSDKSLYMMNHRYAPHVERAIYRLSHLKLGNPKRPLVQQVLLSNFMYAYLNLINQGFIRQQQEALYNMQRQQQKQLKEQQKKIQKDSHYQHQQQQWQEHQKQQRKQRQQQQRQQRQKPDQYMYQQQQDPSANDKEQYNQERKIQYSHKNGQNLHSQQAETGSFSVSPVTGDQAWQGDSEGYHSGDERGNNNMHHISQ